MLEHLGRPQDSLPPVIHVAGTNGKGSVVAFLRAIAEAAGYKVHAYTSPHLVKFHERIRIAGNLITDRQLTELVDACEEANVGNPITFFEFTTAVAFMAFSRNPADLTLLETGLGGRLDATNVVNNPALTVLTPISIDHVNFLGKSVFSIASEKAAIMKPGTPALTTLQDAEAMRVIEEQAAEKGVTVYREGKNWRAKRERGRMVYQKRAGFRDLPMPRLLGDHQIQNAGIAVACFDLLPQFHISDAAIASGLAAVDWPARLQRLTRGPLLQKLAPGWELWLDGGHNGLAGRTLAAQAERWRDQSLFLVFGIMNTKEPESFLAPLAPHVQELFAVNIEGAENALSNEEVAAAAKSVGIEAMASSGLDTALASITRRQDRPGRVLICGSLYLAASVLAKNQ